MDEPTYYVSCPCGEELPIPIHCELFTNEEGQQELAVKPDMTDMWAHYFTHEKD